jgi:hypothetical protein
MLGGSQHIRGDVFSMAMPQAKAIRDRGTPPHFLL